MQLAHSDSNSSRCLHSYTTTFIDFLIAWYSIYPNNFSGIFFMMCHRHHLWHVFGNTMEMAFFIAWHWLVTMPCGALFNIHRNQHWNSHTKVMVFSEDNNPHPNKIYCPWWFTPTNRANGMSYLLVR